MTIHYHGTPITPLSALYELVGRHFCVSHKSPYDVARCHQIGQSVMLDNGAFSQWKSGAPTDWPDFYRWCDRWLDCPTTWAIPPDVIDAPSQEQDALLNEWPHGKRQAAPVWHMDEPLGRLSRLIDAGWSRVCIGSTAQYATVLSESWHRRMDEVWNDLSSFGRTPPIHMLRGMQCSGLAWPFASVDSTDIAQNHHLAHRSPRDGGSVGCDAVPAPVFSSLGAGMFDMNVRYEFRFVGRCPVDSSNDVYDVVIAAGRTIPVEDIIAAGKALREPVFQEQITTHFAAALSCRVTTTGYHSGIKTICSV